VTVASYLESTHNKREKHSKKYGSNGDNCPPFITPDVPPGKFKMFFKIKSGNPENILI